MQPPAPLNLSSLRPKLRNAALRNAAQGRCSGTLRSGRYGLRLSPVRTQATKDAVRLQRITLQLPRRNPPAPNQREHPKDQILSYRQVQNVNPQHLRDTAPADNEKTPFSQGTHPSPRCRQEERHFKQPVKTDRPICSPSQRWKKRLRR